MNIYFDDLTKDFQGKIVFEDISGSINNNEKVGLIGSNGVGKTTLARIIAGMESYEKGSINYSPYGLKIQYLNPNDFNFETIKVSEYLSPLSKEDNKLLTDTQVRIKKALSQAGLEEDILARQINSLSGGEKTKVMLCRAIIDDFDLLILDEPTNHLDLETRAWLEGFIKALSKTVLIISHDRYFLDEAATCIWELNKDELKSYSGNFTSYKLQKENETKNTIKEYDKQQQKIKELERNIALRKEWYDKAHKAAGQNDFWRSKAKKQVSIMHAKEKALERLEDNKVEKPKADAAPAFDIINKNLSSIKLPKYLMRINDLHKSFGERVLLKNASLNLIKGDKAAIIGKNGSGKTTLLKMINGLDKNYSGSISINPSVKIGYFAQELETLDLNNSILDNVLSPPFTISEVRLLLASLLFKGDDVFKKVHSLSMGEKSRVAFAKLMLSQANVLLLDEPTNYLDIVSREKIEEVLQGYKGTILFVSHDRYFINNIANKIFELDNETIVTWEGNFKDYIKNKNTPKDSNKDFSLKSIKEEISKLDLELAFLSGKLSEASDEDEKEKLNNRFLEVSRILRALKDKI